MSPQDPSILPFRIGVQSRPIAEPEPCGTCDGTRLVIVPGGHGDTDQLPCPECDPHDICGRPVPPSPEGREIHVSAGPTPEQLAARKAIADRNAASDIKFLDARRQPRTERVVLAGSPSGKKFSDEVEVGMDGPARKAPVGPSMLVGANGKPISDTPEVTSELIDVRGETLNSLTWPTYLAWRKTKCRPFDMKGLGERTLLSDPGESGRAKDRLLEEIDQATLEFIGEVAELGELFRENGPTTFYGNLRDKLIDECGDILFCGNWAFDAWGMNPLADADDLELLRVTDDNELVAFAGVLAGNQMAVVLGNARFVSMLGGMIWNFMLTAQTNAGLTANAFKKLRYQRREQPAEVQVGRIANVLLVVNQILIIANSSVEEALKVNMRKLDARYPNGYQPGQGGGNRAGEGK